MSPADQLLALDHAMPCWRVWYCDRDEAIRRLDVHAPDLGAAYDAALLILRAAAERVAWGVILEIKPLTARAGVLGPSLSFRVRWALRRAWRVVR